MKEFLSDHNNTTWSGTHSIGLFSAFKAVQVFERRNILEHIHDLDLEKLKQKTESKLEFLWKHYCETHGNIQLPDKARFKEIVEHAFLIDENLKDPILGLNQIYFDLITNGTGSFYFIQVLETYGGM